MGVPDGKADRLEQGSQGEESQKGAFAAGVGGRIRLLADWAWVIWLAVAAALLIRKATLYQSFLRFAQAGAVPVSDMERLG